ncbi:MAG: hypothetical protein DELT_00124 [Desulfovibrio sp.]
MTETSAPYGIASQSDFESQYSRLLEATGCRTQTQLAAVLEIRQSSISDAKRRKVVPSDWLIKLFEKKRVNPQWIRTGLGGKVLLAVDETGNIPVMSITAIERRPVEECTLDELVAELARRILPQALAALQGTSCGPRPN